MFYSTFNRADFITRTKSDAILPDAEHFAYQYHITDTSKDSVLHLFRMQGTDVETCSLACIPNRRATAYVELDGSMGYYPHVFDRFCERALGICPTESDGTPVWPITVEERAARFLFALRHEPGIYLGVTSAYKDVIGYYNRSVIVWGNGLLLLRQYKGCDVQYIETYISPEMVRSFPDQEAAVTLAHQGNIQAALTTFRKWTELQKSHLNRHRF